MKKVTHMNWSSFLPFQTKSPKIPLFRKKPADDFFAALEPNHHESIVEDPNRKPSILRCARRGPQKWIP